MSRSPWAALAPFLAVLAALPAVGQSAPLEGTLEILLEPQGALTVESLEGVEILAAPPGDAEPVRQALDPGAEPGSRAGVRWPDVEPGRWTITCAGETVWCPGWTGRVEGEGERVRLPVFPRARLVGELRVPRHQELPEAVRVEGWVRSASPAVAFEETVAVVAREGEGAPVGLVELAGPAARLDLRVSADGWVPVYRWDLEPRAPVEETAAPTLQLGRLALLRGGSVCGFVQDATTGLPLEGATVQLRPAVDEQTARSEREDERLARLSFEALTNPRGFFQVPGVPAASFRLRVEADSLAPRTLQGVEVVADTETCFREIEVVPYRRAEITVTPPVDPHGLPWRVELFPMAPEPGDPIPTAAVLPDGTSVVEGIPPKPHRVQIFSSRGERLASREEDFEEDRSIHFELDLVEVVGTVLHGEDPLEARVTLGTGSGDQVELASDPEGRFEGWIPRPEHGVLFIRARSDEPPLDRRFREPPPPVRDGVLTLELQLGERVIRGRVETRDGEPVAGALVEAHAPDGEIRQARTDTAGAFELVGLEDEPHRLGAESRSRDRMPSRAPWRQVEPQLEDVPMEEVLVLEPVAEQDGRVLSAEGQAVPGARVSWLAAGPLGSRGQTSTDVEGRFTLPVEAGTWSVVQVAAPSHGLWSACVAAPEEGDDLVLQLPPGAPGQLELSVRTRSEGGPPIMLGDVVIFNDTGGLLNVNDLVAWRIVQGLGPPGEDGLSFPGLLPGVYGATPTPDPWWQQVERACTGTMGTAGDRSALPSGGVVELEVVSP